MFNVKFLEFSLLTCFVQPRYVFVRLECLPKKLMMSATDSTLLYENSVLNHIKTAFEESFILQKLDTPKSFGLDRIPANV